MSRPTNLFIVQYPGWEHNNAPSTCSPSPSNCDSTERLDEVGGALRISELTGRVASAAHIEYHARIVAQKYLARELIEFSSEILNKAFDETNDVDDLMQEAEGKLFEISQRNLKKDVTQIDPVLSEAIRQIQIAANRSDGLSGLQTGFHDIDKITSGWQNSDLIIIAARPAMGKTAFVLSMAKNMAVSYNTPVAIFSLEMSNVQICQSSHHQHLRNPRR